MYADAALRVSRARCVSTNKALHVVCDSFYGKEVKVLLLAENWPPRVGGIERYLSGLMSSLGGQKVSVDVIAPRLAVSSRSASSRAVGGKREERNITVERLRFFWPLMKPAWLPLWWFVSRRVRAEHYDVVLCGKALFEGMLAWRLKRQYGVPYVVFTYAMEIEVWRAHKRTRRQLQRVLQEAARVVYINNVTRRVLRELGVREGQLYQLLPALEETALWPVPPERVAAVLQRYEIRQPYILSVGRLIKRKGFDTLLSAFAALDQVRFEDVQLVLVGDGPEYGALDAQASAEWVDTSVHLLVQIADDELAALYAGAAVFALTPRELPGDMEGFGIVYLEAAAHAVPAVATATGGVPEAVRDGETGLVVADTVLAVREALARLLSDSELRGRLGEAARERVRREFLWPARAAALRATLTQVSGAATSLGVGKTAESVLW